MQQYWDHKYIRVLVDVTVPALGYTTVVLSEKEPETYPVYLQETEHVARMFDDYTIENERIAVTISAVSGRITSLRHKDTGAEMVGAEEGAGFTFIETETATSSAWNIGRYIRQIPVDRCMRIEKTADGGEGSLRGSVKAAWKVADSTIEATYSLDRHQKAVRMDVKVDWNQAGSDIIPVLDYRIPLAYEPVDYQYDIPAGYIRRSALNNDVPGLQYGLARQGEGPCAILVSDSKYGYRAAKRQLGLTLINSSTSPDPYPERGIQSITLWLGVCGPDAKEAEQMATACNHGLFYQPSNSHPGTLPMESSLLGARTESGVISAVLPGEDGKILVRAYGTAAEKEEIALRFASDVAEAKAVNLFGKEQDGEVRVSGNQVAFAVEPYALAEVEVSFA